METFREISQLHKGKNLGPGKSRNQARDQLQLKSYPSLRQNYGRGRPGNPGPSCPSTISQKPLRATKREGSIIRAHRRAHKKLLVTQKALTKQPLPILPTTYSSQSFRSRRRAAKLMAALAAVFILCWAPYVICAIWDIFSLDKS